jgi:hypothetical protein
MTKPPHRNHPIGMYLWADAVFLPIKVLSRVFRGKFVAGLKTAFPPKALQPHGSLAPLQEPRIFPFWLRLLFRHN